MKSSRKINKIELAGLVGEVAGIEVAAAAAAVEEDVGAAVATAVDPITDQGQQVAGRDVHDLDPGGPEALHSSEPVHSPELGRVHDNSAGQTRALAPDLDLN